MIIKKHLHLDDQRRNRRTPLRKRTLYLALDFKLICVLSLLIVSISNLLFSTEITSHIKETDETYRRPLQKKNHHSTTLQQPTGKIETKDNETKSASSHKMIHPLRKENMGYATVDILSIGSVNRLEYLATQQETFATHISVRHFFNVTEHDDVDKDCHKLGENATTYLNSIIQFCRHHHRTHHHQHSEGSSSHHNGFSNRLVEKYFAPDTILSQKSNPMAWLCAQTRPAVGLYNILQDYKATKKFPDYLIIIDDDTYLNLNLIQGNLG